MANLINDNEDVPAKAEHKPQNRHSWTPGETRGRRGRGRRGRQQRKYERVNHNSNEPPKEKVHQRKYSYTQTSEPLIEKPERKKSNAWADAEVARQILRKGSMNDNMAEENGTTTEP